MVTRLYSSAGSSQCLNFPPGSPGRKKETSHNQGRLKGLVTKGRLGGTEYFFSDSTKGRLGGHAPLFERGVLARDLCRLPASNLGRQVSTSLEVDKKIYSQTHQGRLVRTRLQIWRGFQKVQENSIFFK